ncbi:hypothetical protein IWW34DRAFT_773497 [Fusarium oxysporum f. sp. albedinis]|nr:hypothetical protein IWW34DRAFT_773497 [Fusarium oxysporum f. sp. albedinis]
MENTHLQNQTEFLLEPFELYGARFSQHLVDKWYQSNEVISTQSNDIRVTEKAVDSEGEVTQSLFTLLIGLSGNGRNS